MMLGVWEGCERGVFGPGYEARGVYVLESGEYGGIFILFFQEEETHSPGVSAAARCLPRCPQLVYNSHVQPHSELISK